MTEEGVQADIPEPSNEETTLKIRPLERIKLHPKVPIEPSTYGKGNSFSRPWILQDGRVIPDKGSEMRDNYKVPRKATHREGIRKRMLTDFFWEQMLDEVIEELATSQPVTEYCTEHDANYIKENFQPRDLAVTADKNLKADFRIGVKALLDDRTCQLGAVQHRTEALKVKKRKEFSLSQLVCSHIVYSVPHRTRFGRLVMPMHLKYPLYGTGSSAITYYSENIQKTGPGEILEKFRRCQFFTKPMEERLDNGWVL